MTQVPIILQARMNSQRFPGKMLHSIKDRPLIEYVITRLKQSRQAERVIVATSTEKEDEAIVNYCKEHKVEIFQGELKNVASRFKALVEHYGLNAFVRVCGDSPLIDVRLIDQGLRTFETGEYDIVTNVLKRTFPRGQSYQIVKAEMFLKNFHRIRGDENQEHVLSYFLNNAGRYRIHNTESPDAELAKINLCVDSEKDVQKIEKILDHMKSDYKDYTWVEIVEIYQSLEKTALIP